MTKRIFIGSDPLMTAEFEQTSNNRWLLDLLKRPISRATNIVPDLWKTGGEGCMDRAKFFDLSGIALDENATQFWYDYNEVSEESKAYLSTFLRAGDVVVGYEMCEQTRKVLADIGVDYIDVWLHPIRFLDDVLFAFNSNKAEVHQKLFDFDFDEDQMFLHADRLKIQTYKGWRRVEADIQENSALFVGQMLNDKSVCDDGRMLNLLDFQEEVEQAARDHSMVYYARHPYMRTGDEHILDYVKKHPKIQFTQVPTYRMLASPKLSKVFGVSSSVITEARYFDKEAQHLFKPIFSFGVKNDPESYASVYQSFISPHFWERVLSPLLDTYECPEIMFSDSKNKIRDMLGFYWAHADIDKTEHMRRELTSLRQAVRRAGIGSSTDAPPKARTQSIAGFYQTSSQIAQIERDFSNVDVVSFDIFDTLIERIVDRPGDIHAMMQAQVFQITDGRIEDFAKARREARDQALHAANGEEVLLRDRYQAMAQHYGLTSEMGEELHQLELEMERRICRSRPTGLRLLKHALAKGKRVILVSDIFFERDFVEELLQGCGVTGWHRLYLSSEEGVLKHTGRLFDVVLAQEAVDPARIIHLGDNDVADIEQGSAKGLHTAHLPEKRLIADRISPSIKAFSAISDQDTKSLVRGLVSREITKSTIPDQPGHTNSDHDTLGYAAGGPFFWGFAKWIMKTAKAHGLTDLYFLARDGDIARRCYDRIAQSDPTAPRSHYLLASRRAVNVARLTSTQDILSTLSTSFTPCTLGTLLRNRFGVDGASIPLSAYNDAGYRSQDDMAVPSTDMKKLEKFFSSHAVSSTILTSAAREKSALVEAYSKEGLNDPSRKVGFIDIGHSGSLQAAIQDIMSIKSSVGLYFATKDDIDEKIGSNSIAYGYVADRIGHSDKNHFYQKHILMFELLFQNRDGSFICYERNGETLVPKFLDLAGEADRVAFIESVHSGATRFCADICAAEEEIGLNLELTGPEAVLGYQAFLSKPFTVDAELMRGIGFENKYNARDMQWVVASSPATARNAIWREATDLFFSKKVGRATIVSSDSLNLTRTIFQMFVLNARKRAKLKRDPDAFFADSQKPIVRFIGQVI